MNSDTFFSHEPFELESGAVLPGIHIQYATAGQLNEARDNVIWVCHALTGNAVVTDWWSQLFGAGKIFDPDRFFIICANMLGSCYGSTYALSPRAEGEDPWYHDFPLLTNRDIARGFDLLRRHLGLEKIHLSIGSSLGGQQLLEFAYLQPEVFQHIVPIATNAKHSPWGIAFNEAQRMSIAADASWKEQNPAAGMEGMKAARATALLSYRGYDTYEKTQTDAEEKWDDFRASSYQRYQGEKIARRFDAFAYWTLSKAMDSHDIGRGRGGAKAALGQIPARALVIGVSSDLLFPVAEQKFLAEHLPQATYAEIDSIYGHDGFLVEMDQLNGILLDFLASTTA
ncbi:MAG: homoserine O-acetyltransferase [Bacteroidota bacterium]